VRHRRHASPKAQRDRESLPGRLNRIQEQERGRLAADIHDHLGALLAVLRSHLDRATKRLEGVTAGAVALLGEETRGKSLE